MAYLKCSGCGNACNQSAKYCPECGFLLASDQLRSGLAHQRSMPAKRGSVWFWVILVNLLIILVTNTVKQRKQNAAIQAIPIMSADEMLQEYELHDLQERRRLRMSNGDPNIYRQLLEDDERAEKRRRGGE